MSFKNIDISFDDKRVKEVIRSGAVLLCIVVPMAVLSFALAYKLNDMKIDMLTANENIALTGRAASELEDLEEKINRKVQELPESGKPLTKEYILADLNEICGDNGVDIKKFAEQPVKLETQIKKLAFLITLDGKTSNVLSVINRLSGRHALKAAYFEAEESRKTFVLIFTDNYGEHSEASNEEV